MKNSGYKLFIVNNNNCTQEEAELIVRFAITAPPPRREYWVYTKNEPCGIDLSGKKLIITYISRIEYKNGIKTLNSISEEEYGRCKQVIKEMFEFYEE